MDYNIISCEEDDIDIIEEKIGEYIFSIVPPAEGATQERVALKITDENDKIIAGCIMTFYPWGALFVNALCVDARYRKQGLGSYLFCEAERFAREKGAYMAILYTMSYQARGFYQKHGYDEWLAREYPNGYISYGFLKRFDKNEQTKPRTDKRYEVKLGTKEDAKTIGDILDEYVDSIIECEDKEIPCGKKMVDANGETIAAVDAEVGDWGIGYLGSLWVEEPYRKRGLATKLLESAEREMKENGCKEIYVYYVFDWTVEFFKKRGYFVAGVVEDFPKGHNYYTMTKKL